MKNESLYKILGLAVLALIVGPIGIAVFVLAFVHGDSPCVLCWAQRTGMILIALTGLFILRFGPRPRYVGLAVLISAYGLYMGARHSALHLWPGHRSGLQHRDPGGPHLHLVGVHLLVCPGADGRAALAHEGRRSARGSARSRGPRSNGHDPVPGGGGRQHDPGLRRGGAPALHGPGRPHPLLLQPPQLGLVPGGVGARAAVLARAVRDREARPWTVWTAIGARAPSPGSSRSR